MVVQVYRFSAMGIGYQNAIVIDTCPVLNTGGRKKERQFELMHHRICDERIEVSTG